MTNIRLPASRQQVIEVVERRNKDGIIPTFLLKWWGNGLYDAIGRDLLEINEIYPDDIYVGWLREPGTTESPMPNPSYRWGYKDYSDQNLLGLAQNPVLLNDWDELPLMLDDFPDPYEEGIFNHINHELETDRTGAKDKYKLGGFWMLFHEKLWTLRGMENLFMDYYDHMDLLKVLARKLLDFHKVIVDRYAELGFDGIFTSDDLGHQTGPMMSPAIFRELYFPLYKELADHIHSHDMHFWLHSCGDNTLLMDDLIEAGLDVFHPVQKGCMDEVSTLEKFAGKISFMYGIDVQHLLPEADPDEVRREILQMAELFRVEGGGLILAAGNGIMPGTPPENIRAMFDTVFGL